MRAYLQEWTRTEPTIVVHPYGLPPGLKDSNIPEDEEKRHIESAKNLLGDEFVDVAWFTSDGSEFIKTIPIRDREGNVNKRSRHYTSKK
jgi:hypothetical protein